MNTKFSAIRSWLEAKSQKQFDSNGTAGFVTRLGDVKIETKTPGGSGPVDQILPVEHFPD